MIVSFLSDAATAIPAFLAQWPAMVFGALAAIVLGFAFWKAGGIVAWVRVWCLRKLCTLCQKLNGTALASPTSKSKIWTEDAVSIGVLWTVCIVLGILMVVGAVGGLENFWHSSQVPPLPSGGVSPGAVYTALLWAGGCLVTGSFLGFLFGVPRVVQNGDGAATGNAARGPGITYQANTALEQVADWLTKMVVGVGLVQLRKIPGYLEIASQHMSRSYGNQPASEAFGVALIVYFVLVGFLGSYLMTKLYLQAALLRSDSGTLGSAPEKANMSAEEVIALKTATLGFSERERVLTGLAGNAAAKLIREVDFDELAESQDFALWGKAKLNAQQFDDAVRAYIQACQRAPADVEIRLEYATALYLNERQRRRQDLVNGILTNNQLTIGSAERVIRRSSATNVRQQLIIAYRGLGPGSSSDLKRNVFKNLTYVYLFNDETDIDFQQSIRYGEEYQLDRRHVPSGGLCVNLACAYGQKFAWLETQLTAENLEEADRQRLLQDRQLAREKALLYVKAALDLDPTWLVRFQALLQKQFPGKSGDDTDLESFETDPAFRELLQLPHAAPIPPRPPA